MSSSGAEGRHVSCLWGSSIRSCGGVYNIDLFNMYVCMYVCMSSVRLPSSVRPFTPEGGQNVLPSQFKQILSQSDQQWIASCLYNHNKLKK